MFFFLLTSIQRQMILQIVDSSAWIKRHPKGIKSEARFSFRGKEERIYAGLDVQTSGVRVRWETRVGMRRRSVMRPLLPSRPHDRDFNSFSDFDRQTDADTGVDGLIGVASSVRRREMHLLLLFV